jgi:hypothetical protein
MPRLPVKPRGGATLRWRWCLLVRQVLDVLPPNDLDVGDLN